MLIRRFYVIGYLALGTKGYSTSPSSCSDATRTLSEAASTTTLIPSEASWQHESPASGNETVPTPLRDGNHSNNTARIHHVVVGAGGNLTFLPSIVQAALGDHVQFEFLKLNHTLTRSTLESPCHWNGSLDTGFNQFNPANSSGKFIVDLEVTSEEPQWFFCRQVIPTSHCRKGMVFALNPKGNVNVFFDNARNASGLSPIPSSRTFAPGLSFVWRNGSTMSDGYNVSPTGTGMYGASSGFASATESLQTFTVDPFSMPPSTGGQGSTLPTAGSIDEKANPSIDAPGHTSTPSLAPSGSKDLVGRWVLAATLVVWMLI
ncbi:MAG: hypothetical protein M1833_004264 [Piccolia ochrophora]|nr:MAG: hypothetical protein M1833_004264 [Piccolia ochrophora]